MPITVELQDMHSYSPLMIIVVIIFVILSIGAVLFMIIKRYMKTNSTPRIQMTYASRENIKQKYWNLLNNLETKCRGDKISNRKAYQELSKIVRHFVHEATGIKVHNYTLDEIRTINISGLYDVINECYTPEFSVDKNGEIYCTIAKARKVIQEWN